MACTKRLWKKFIQNCEDKECEVVRKTYVQVLDQEWHTGSLEDKKETAYKKKVYNLKLKILQKQ